MNSSDIVDTIKHPGMIAEAPFHSYSGGYHCYGSRDGDVVINGMGIWEGGVRKETLRAYNKKTDTELWRIYTTPHTYLNNCYNPITERIVSFVGTSGSGVNDISDSGSDYIEERDAKTGKVIRTLKGTKLGNFVSGDAGYGGSSSVVYDPEDVDRIWLTQYTKHVLLCVDWQGTVYKQLGEYGIPGLDDTHLFNPKGVSTKLPISAGLHLVAVADRGNHRILICPVERETISMKLSFLGRAEGGTAPARMQLPFPNPSVAFLFGSSILAVYNGGSYPYYGAFVIDDYVNSQARWLYPQNTDCFVSHPAKPWIVLVSWGENLIREIDLRRFTSFSQGRPISTALFKTVNVKRGITYPSPPIVTWFRPRNTVFIKATKAGRLDIKVAKFGAFDWWTGDWETCDSIALTANTLSSYTPTGEMGIYRVEVTLKEDGVVDGWVNLSF